MGVAEVEGIEGVVWGVMRLSRLWICEESQKITLGYPRG